MMADYREEEGYEEFADWLFHRIAQIKGSRSLGRIRIITDDEPGLYNPFIRVFGAIHGLCYVHMEKSLMR